MCWTPYTLAYSNDLPPLSRVRLPGVDRGGPVLPADADVLPDFAAVVFAAGDVEVRLLPEGGAQRLHGLRRDLDHQPVCSTAGGSASEFCKVLDQELQVVLPSTMLDLAMNPDDAFSAPLNTTKLAPVTGTTDNVNVSLAGGFVLHADS